MKPENVDFSEFPEAGNAKSLTGKYRAKVELKLAVRDFERFWNSELEKKGNPKGAPQEEILEGIYNWMLPEDIPRKKFDEAWKKVPSKKMPWGKKNIRPGKFINVPTRHLLGEAIRYKEGVCVSQTAVVCALSRHYGIPCVAFMPSEDIEGKVDIFSAAEFHFCALAKTEDGNKLVDTRVKRLFPKYEGKPVDDSFLVSMSYMSRAMHLLNISRSHVKTHPKASLNYLKRARRSSESAITWDGKNYFAYAILGQTFTLESTSVYNHGGDAGQALSIIANAFPHLKRSAELSEGQGQAFSIGHLRMAEAYYSKARLEYFLSLEGSPANAKARESLRDAITWVHEGLQGFNNAPKVKVAFMRVLEDCKALNAKLD